MDLENLIKEVVGKVLEGGKALGTDRIPKANIQPTIQAFEEEALRTLSYYSLKPIGSTGKKSSSGDIDLGLSTDKSMEDVAAEIQRLGFRVKVNKGLGEVSVEFPQYGPDGEPTDLRAQVDLMFGPEEWTQTQYYGPGEESKYGGVHVRGLVNALAQVLTGRSISPARGFFKKDDPEKKYSQDWNPLLDDINQKSREKWSLEDLRQPFEKMWEKANRSFSPTDLAKIKEYYLGFMKSTKSDVPTELAEWMAYDKVQPFYGPKTGAQMGHGNIGGARNRGQPGYPVPPEVMHRRGTDEDEGFQTLEEATDPSELEGGIKHLDDLKPEEFMRFLKKFSDMEIAGGLEISEKVDGSARLSFGPGTGHIWTQTKNGSRKAMSSQYPDQPMYQAIKKAHQALESKASQMLKSWPDGISFMVAEVLYTKVPNTIEYGPNVIMIHGVHSIEGVVGDAESKKAAQQVIKSAGGALNDGQEDWKFEYKRNISPKDVMIDVRNEYDTLGDLYNGLQKTPRDKDLKAKFQEVQKRVKQKLLGQLHKQRSAYGPEGGDVEGIVFRDLESGAMTKLVDKDYFTKLNQFMWNWRKRIGKEVFDEFTKVVAKDVLGDPSLSSTHLMKKLLTARDPSDSSLPPEQQANKLIARYIKKNDLMSGDFSREFQKALMSAFRDFDKIKSQYGERGEERFEYDVPGTGSKKVRTPGQEISGRTEASFQTAAATLAGIKSGMKMAAQIKDPLTQKVALFKLFLGHRFGRLVDQLGSQEKLDEGGPIDRGTGPIDFTGSPRIDGQVEEAPNWLKGAAAAAALGFASPVGSPENVRQSQNTIQIREDQIETIATAVENIHRLPKNLIMAMINVESSGKSGKVSNKGAAGFMQLMPRTAKSLGVTDVHDMKQNIEAGGRYMRMMLDRYNGNLPKALAAYNFGPSAVDRTPYKRWPHETKEYIVKVKKQMDILKNSGSQIDSVIREQMKIMIESTQQGTIGITIGRFQPFHKGHAEIIRKLCSEFSNVIVFIAGQTKDADNPFSHDLRMKMMELSLPDVWSKIKVFPAIIAGKSNGYIPGLIQQLALNGEASIPLNGSVTVLVGSDRYSKQLQMKKYNEDHKGEPGYFNGNIEVIEMKDVKNDDTVGRISGTGLRAAILEEDMETVEAALDPHLVGSSEFKSIYIQLKKQLMSDGAAVNKLSKKKQEPAVAKKKNNKTIKEVVASIVNELAAGTMEGPGSPTRGGGTSGWSRAILARDMTGEELYQHLQSSPRMMQLNHKGVPNENLPSFDPLEQKQSSQEDLSTPSDLSEIIYKIFTSLSEATTRSIPPHTWIPWSDVPGYQPGEPGQLGRVIINGEEIPWQPGSGIGPGEKWVAAYIGGNAKVLGRKSPYDIDVPQEKEQSESGVDIIAQGKKYEVKQPEDQKIRLGTDGLRRAAIFRSKSESAFQEAERFFEIARKNQGEVEGFTPEDSVKIQEYQNVIESFLRGNTTEKHVQKAAEMFRYLHDLRSRKSRDPNEKIETPWLSGGHINFSQAAKIARLLGQELVTGDPKLVSVAKNYSYLESEYIDNPDSFISDVKNMMSSKVLLQDIDGIILVRPEKGFFLIPRDDFEENIVFSQFMNLRPKMVINPQYAGRLGRILSPSQVKKDLEIRGNLPDFKDWLSNRVDKIKSGDKGINKKDKELNGKILNFYANVSLDNLSNVRNSVVYKTYLNDREWTKGVDKQKEI